MKHNISISVSKIQGKQRPRKGKYGNFYSPVNSFEIECLQLLQQLNMKTKENVKLNIILKDYSRCDVDNIAKIIQDVLQSLRKIENDAQIKDLHIYFSEEKCTQELTIKINKK